MQTKTTTRTGYLRADEEPIINVQVLESLIAWRNWCYWQEQRERERLYQQTIEELRDAVEEEQRTP